MINVKWGFIAETLMRSDRIVFINVLADANPKFARTTIIVNINIFYLETSEKTFDNNIIGPSVF